MNCERTISVPNANIPSPPNSAYSPNQLSIYRPPVRLAIRRIPGWLCGPLEHYVGRFSSPLYRNKSKCRQLGRSSCATASTSPLSKTARTVCAKKPMTFFATHRPTKTGAASILLIWWHENDSKHWNIWCILLQCCYQHFSICLHNIADISRGGVGWETLYSSLCVSMCVYIKNLSM